MPGKMMSLILLAAATISVVFRVAIESESPTTQPKPSAIILNGGLCPALLLLGAALTLTLLFALWDEDGHIAGLSGGCLALASVLFALGIV